MPDYPTETLGEDDDDGTMVDNVTTLKEAVIGHRIVRVDTDEIDMGSYYGVCKSTVLVLDDGTKVRLTDTDDCCAYTEVEKFLLHPECVDHIITGVGTTDGYTTWHIYADMGDVLELTVGWSCGNPFYYGYGFSIKVESLG